MRCTSPPRVASSFKLRLVLFLQLYALRRLVQGDAETPKGTLGNNVRALQPLHHRTVRTNIDFTNSMVTSPITRALPRARLKRETVPGEGVHEHETRRPLPGERQDHIVAAYSDVTVFIRFY